MIVPRPSAIPLYVALLILVVAAIVFLLWQSARLEEGAESRAAYYARHGIPLRNPLPPAYDIPSSSLSSASGDSGRFAFTPYTIKPRCLSRCVTDDFLRHVPPAQRTRLACDGTIGLHIDKEGRVTETDILRSSGNEVCDRAAHAWARTTRWTTAYNLDQPVAVWIAQPFDLATSEP